jgi:hypothetical protein
VRCALQSGQSRGAPVRRREPTIEAIHHEPEAVSEKRAIPDPNQEQADMGPEDFRKMIEGKQLATPHVIMTRNGRSYTITDAANAYIAPAYPSTVTLFIREKGVIMLGLDAIEVIQHEREAMAGQ